MDTSGQKIEYSQLVGKLRDVKEKVRESILKESQRIKSSPSIPGFTKQTKAVYDKLAQFNEELALKFRQLTSRETLVRSLYEMIDDENFFETAGEIILKHYNKDALSHEKQLSLKRVCWCLLSSN